MYIPEYLKTTEKYERFLTHQIYSGCYGKSKLYFVDFIDRYGARITDETVSTNGGKTKAEIQLRKCYSDENESAIHESCVDDIISLLYQPLRKVFKDNITITFENNILTFVTSYDTELSKWYDHMKKDKEETERRIAERTARETAECKSWSEMKPDFSLLTPLEQETMRDQQKVYGIINNWRRKNGR